MANEQILQKLKDALDAGVLTEEEYNKKVADLGEVGEAPAPEQPQEEAVSKEIPESDIPEDDGVVYFNTNENVKSTSGTSEGHEYYQNPSVNVGKKPKKKKKKWIIIGAIVLVVILLGAIGSCGGGDDVSNETYDWPTDSETAQMLPTPEGDITYIDVSEGEYLDADVTLSEGKACKAYIDACKEKGFTDVQDSSQSSGDYDFTAKNEEGWQVNVYNFDEEMSISLQSPSWLSDIEDDSDEDADKDTEESDADFRQTMDDYEAFVDEYIEFMDKYENSDDTTAMLADYTEMMATYSDFAEKIDNIDEDSLSDSDYDYYIEVTTRCSEKLAKAAL